MLAYQHFATAAVEQSKVAVDDEDDGVDLIRANQMTQRMQKVKLRPHVEGGQQRLTRVMEEPVQGKQRQTPPD